MALRVYLMPATGTGASRADARRPKYSDQLTRWVGMDYGHEPAFLVWGEAIDHAALVANPDVIAAPADLNQSIGAALTNVQAKLEGFKIPADWITAGMTYKAALKGVALIFQLAQRYAGNNAGEKLLDADTLDLRFNQLSAAKRTKLREMADSFGLDRSGLDNTSTIRDFLKAMAAQNFMQIKTSLGAESLIL